MSWPAVNAIDWYEIKLFFQHASGFSMDALHVIAGVAVQLLAALLLRSSVGRIGPLAAVFALELLNEANDLRVERWPSVGMQVGEGVKDIALTVAVPLLLYAIANWRPQLLARRPAPPAVAEANGATRHESGRGAAE